MTGYAGGVLYWASFICCTVAVVYAAIQWDAAEREIREQERGGSSASETLWPFLVVAYLWMLLFVRGDSLINLFQVMSVFTIPVGFYCSFLWLGEKRRERRAKQNSAPHHEGEGR